MNKERLIAFTDAIIAIAATIMVLELKIPETNDIKEIIAERYTFISYIISFFMIYLVWYSHHNLFEKADNITPKAYLLNGLWIFFLTLVPFTTSWVGKASNSVLPEFLYSLDLLLWCAAFQILNNQILKDNKNARRDVVVNKANIMIMYIGFIISMIVSFIKPVLSLYVVALITFIMLFEYLKVLKVNNK